MISKVDIFVGFSKMALLAVAEFLVVGFIGKIDPFILMNEFITIVEIGFVQTQRFRFGVPL